MYHTVSVLTICLCISSMYFVDMAFSIQLEYNFITERPVTTFVNRSLVKYWNFTTTRYSRQDPIYYVNMNIETKVVLDDNSSEIHLSIYEFLSNQYRPSFIEIHYKWCKFVYNDLLFGVQLKRSLPPSCPHPPGKYNLLNMTVPSAVIPKGFPFTKGRIYSNLTYYKSVVFSGHIDLELKYKRRVKKQ